MHLIALGMNHRTAPVELRERLAFSAPELPAALTRLAALDEVAEVVLLSTCNRTEVYATVTAPAQAAARLAATLAELRGLPAEAITPFLYRHEELEAVRHLFRVAAGLDSMVLGETQILGQVRDAYRQAAETGVVGKYMHHLMHQALAAAKRAHTETAISEMPVSVPYAAVELAKKLFQSLQGRTVLCIGAGEMAELTVRHLVAAGVGQILVANRTLERAEKLAGAFGGRAIPLEAVPGALQEVDVVISSTGAEGYLLTREMVERALRARRGRPIFLFDIAVPRDVDPAVGELEGAFLYNIDDLEQVVAQNLQERAREAVRAEAIVAEEVERFQAWLNTQAVVPTIRQLREKADRIRQAELQRALGRLPNLSDRERKVIEALTVAIVNKILNDPTQELKRLAEDGGRGEARAAAALVARLFRLEPARADDPAVAAADRALRASWGRPEDCPVAGRRRTGAAAEPEALPAPGDG
ncbi:MAG: glutamyl-tRNA reductase [Firmicutes bacterium]|nr:glutamyl-tRNA reductase [Bacillota bacterium]